MQPVDSPVCEFVFVLLGSALRGKVKENFKLPLIPFQVPRVLLVRHANRPERGQHVASIRAKDLLVSL